MKIDTRLRELGPVNHAELKQAVATIPQETWLEDSLRQDRFDVHAKTQSVILLFADGWPEVRVTKRAGWDKYSRLIMPVMREIIGKHYSYQGTVIRAVFAKLVAGGKIDEHIDGHESFSIAHRIHVPLITNDEVDFVIGGETFRLAEGIAYEVNNLDFHYVENRSDKDRVHFIFDYAPDELPS